MTDEIRESPPIRRPGSASERVLSPACGPGPALRDDAGITSAETPCPDVAFDYRQGRKAHVRRSATIGPEPKASRATSRTLVIACGAIAREIVAVIERNGLANVDVTCLPAIWHNHPERIPEGVRAKIRAARENYDAIYVGYGDCGTGGLLDKVLAEEGGVERLPGPHCYAFFSGTEAFLAASDDEFDAFYLTDYLARHFDKLIWEGFGLDLHPELRDMVFGNYAKVVYLAQTDDPALERLAARAAERLALPLETRRTGYGDLDGFLRAANDAMDGR